MTEKQEGAPRFSRGLEPNTPENIAGMIAERDQLLLGYLAGLDRAEQDHAEEWSRQLAAQGGRLKPLAVVTPIAAHQESPRMVYDALAQYAGQRGCAPFSIILGLNTPARDAAHPNVARVATAIEHARHDFTSLDIRVLHESYENPTIGRIRRDLWNAVVWQSYEQTANGWLTETVGVSHDIDLVRLSPYFIAGIQNHYRDEIDRLAFWGPFWRDVSLKPASTSGKHAYDKRFPNASRVVYYLDYMSRMSRGGYEAGMVIPVSYYAAEGGIDANAKTHEIGGLTWVRQDDMTHLTVDTVYDRPIVSETSMRRFTSRLQDPSVGLHNIWTRDTFGPDDDCRTDVPAADIPADRLETVIADALERDVPYHVLDPRLFILKEYDRINYPLAADKAKERARKRLHMTEQMVRRALGLTALADATVERYRDIPDLYHQKAMVEGKAYAILNMRRIERIETINRVWESDIDLSGIPPARFRKPPVTNDDPLLLAKRQADEAAAAFERD